MLAGQQTREWRDHNSAQWVFAQTWAERFFLMDAARAYLCEAHELWSFAVPKDERMLSLLLQVMVSELEWIDALALATELEQRDQPTVEHETLLNEGGLRFVNVFP